MVIYVNIEEKNYNIFFMLFLWQFLLIYVNIADKRTDRQTHQRYSLEPQNIFFASRLFRMRKKNLELGKNELIFIR